MNHVLASFFEASGTPCGGSAVRRTEQRSGLAVLLEDLQKARCLYLRIGESDPHGFALEGAYRLELCEAGGWLLESTAPSSRWHYWIPAPPMLRKVDAAGRILDEGPANWSSFSLHADRLEIGFPATPHAWVLDCVVWQLADSGLVAELLNLTPIEIQGYFLLGSHTCYRKPADLYRHLVFGHVYEDRYAWPHQRKICSENDAHALWQILAGLERATGKRLYRILKSQLLLAVLDRQSEDGGFRHGEWTDNFESHYRLHCSAMHLFMDALEEEGSPRVSQALRKAAVFLANTTDSLECGRWFLHDELEQSVEALKLGPGRSQASRAFGKSVSNLLVLNTHLDSTIALDRYGALTGDPTYKALVQEANRATDRVLASRPAEHLYKIAFSLIELTFLPTEVARRLPTWKRALKRLAWRYLIPQLPYLKQRFPRLVMPGGYIDREISAVGLAHDYHAVNLMDLARHQRRVQSSVRDQTLEEGLYFVQRSGLNKRWKEMDYHSYALGFWAEALYQAYLSTAEPSHLAWLAEAVLDLEDRGAGLPPSLLGANAECTPVARQLWPTWPSMPGLRVVNLSQTPSSGLLLVNASSAPIHFAVEAAEATGLKWFDASGLAVLELLTVPARSWVLGKSEI